MYTIKDGVIRISVRNLVEFIYSSGDLDNRNTGAQDVKAMQEGSRLHRKIQKAMGSEYRAEVSLKMEVPIQHEYAYVIAVEGRADGIITADAEDVCIDEIKTMQKDLSGIEDAAYVHKAQAICYAYIYAVQNHLERMRIRLTYCNVDTEEIKYFYEEYTSAELEEWFDRLMTAFSKWTDFVFEEREKRNTSIQTLKFPFAYRTGQKRLAASVYHAIEDRQHLFIQAPTGVGKTISTIYPAVMAVGQKCGDKIFYLTAKTITRTVAEDTYEILREGGLHFRTVTLTAKDKICILEKRDCNPVSCPRAAGHFDRVNDAVYDMITHETAIDRDKILIYAEKHNVCPFEMSLDISSWCDGIICDYNYVFNPNSKLQRFFAAGEKGDYIFLIDESHNLVERAREMYSASVVKEEILAVKKLVKDIDKKLAAALERCNKDLLEWKRECDEYVILDSASAFSLHLDAVYSLMQKFMDKHKNFEHNEELLNLFFEIRHFLNMHDIINDKYVIYTEHRGNGDFVLTLFCVDPSDNLTECLKQGNCAIFFSATLLPVQYFKEMLTGDAAENAIYAHSPFDEANRKIMIGRDVSSKYTRRNAREYGRIATYIQSIIAAKQGNYLVFFPSYRFMQEVYESGGWTTEIECQSAAMKEEDREAFLARFDDENANVTGFCVMGGIFSEGIDLKNDRLIGAVIVGTGLPMVCNERQILKNYFDEKERNGFAYAYVFPGMNKVLQAAGRVIRTDEDRGIIALLDERFLKAEYQKLFPLEWGSYEVTDQSTVFDSVKKFWEK